VQIKTKKILSKLNNMKNTFLILLTILSLTAYSQRTDTTISKINHPLPKQSQLSKAGSYFTAGGSFLAVSAIMYAGSNKLNDPTLYKLSIGTGIIGAVCILVGGVKITKASKQFNQINLTKNKVLQIDYYGSYASINLKF
jgi:hypothetical protein